MGRLLAVAAYPGDEGGSDGEPIPLFPHRRLADWDVHVAGLLTDDLHDGLAGVSWTIRLDAARHELDIIIRRETWDHTRILRMRPEPGESADRRAQRETALRLVHELLSFSYDLPA